MAPSRDLVAYDYAIGQEVWAADNNDGWVKGEITALDGEHWQVEINGICRNLKSNELLPLNPSELDNVDNLMEQEYLHEAGILNTLELRSKDEKVYTYTGPIIISVNPYSYLPIYGPEFIEKYRGRKLGEEEPHIYAIADTAYQTMSRERANQSVLISGESGAGKTEATKFILNYLAAVATREENFVVGKQMNPLMRMKRVEQQIIDSSPVLEAFGNAKTVRNDNSSRFGKFIEIQFDDRGVIVGARIVNYLLEKSRVVGQGEGERNYHVFYQLTKGAPMQERTKLSLADQSEYRILGGCREIEGVDDAEDFRILRQALTVVGLGSNLQQQLYATVSAVLRIGNLTFKESDNDESYVENNADLEIVAKLLELNIDELRDALTTKTVKAGAEKLRSPLNAQQAAYAADAMSKGIYGRLFNWLVVKINDSICKSNPAHFIGVLDIFGFEIFAVNSFEQLCINFANEKLQQHFNMHVFKLEQQEYIEEGIDWSAMQFIDNEPCVELIEKKATGILALLDEQCVVPKATDQTFVDMIDEVHNSNQYYEKNKKERNKFIVHHFAGSVTYSGEGFLDKNKDALMEDVVNCVKSSSSQFVKDFFICEHGAGSEETKQEKKGGRGGRTKNNTVALFFRQQLNSLMNKLGSTSPHYVRCIKPNQKKVPLEFEKLNVLRQLRCAGVLEAMKIRRAGFPVRRSLREFYDRYRCLGMMKPLSDENAAKLGCQQLLDQVGLAPESFTFGKTKIFLRDKQFSMLEARREELLRKSAIKIQNSYRTYDRRRYMRELRRSTAVLQAFIARKFWNRQLCRRRAASIIVASLAKRTIRGREMENVRDAAETLRDAVISASSFRSYFRKRAAAGVLGARAKRSTIIVQLSKEIRMAQDDKFRREEEERMKKEAEERARREEIEQKEREAKRLQEEEEKKARESEVTSHSQEIDDEKSQSTPGDQRAGSNEEQVALQSEVERTRAMLDKMGVSAKDTTPGRRRDRRKSISGVEKTTRASLSTLPQKYPEMEGFLYKQGGSHKNWKKRWVLLKEMSLYYFRSTRDMEPAGYLPIEDCVVEKAEIVTQRPFAFVVSLPERNFFFAAESEEETNAWIEAIKEAQTYHFQVLGKEPSSLSRARRVTNVDKHASDSSVAWPERRGWLTKLSGGRFTKWQKRFFVLKEAVLSYYQKEDDSYPAGVINLDECHCEITEKMNKKYCFELSTPSRNYYIVGKNQDDADDWMKDIQLSQERLAALIAKQQEREKEEAMKRKSIKPTMGGLSSDGYLREGWLEKQGGSFKNWKKRYFLLKDYTLYYYKNELDPSPIGYIPLEQATVEKADEKTGKPNSMQISTPSRNFFLCADDADLLQQWVASIRKEQSRIDFNLSLFKETGCSQSAEGPIGVPPVLFGGMEKEGYLYKQGGSVKNWKKRWFSLKELSLYYFKSPQDSYPLGLIPLDDCLIEVSDEKLTGKEFSMELSTPGRTFLVAADSAEIMESWIDTIRRIQSQLLAVTDPSVLTQGSVHKSENKEKRKELPLKSSLTDRRLEGWLHKQGAGNRAWKRRWFILNNLDLYYFKTQQDEVPAGVVNLEHCSVDVADELVEKENSLELFTPSRNFYLFADSKDEVQKWETTIRDVQKEKLGSSYFTVVQDEYKAMPGVISLKVSASGIDLLRYGDDIKKDQTVECFASYGFQDIFSWSCSQTTFSIVSFSEKRMYAFKTRRGKDIRDTVESYAYALFESTFME